ncbi:unnamed protein product, partial [Ectocarpus sp. 8 AP-2014]
YDAKEKADSVPLPSPVSSSNGVAGGVGREMHRLRMLIWALNGREECLKLCFLSVFIVSVLTFCPRYPAWHTKKIRVRRTIKYIYFNSFVLVQVKTSQLGGMGSVLCSRYGCCCRDGGFTVRGGKVLD